MLFPLRISTSEQRSVAKSIKYHQQVWQALSHQTIASNESKLSSGDGRLAAVQNVFTREKITDQKGCMRRMVVRTMKLCEEESEFM